jgi:hypothetical protein
MTIRGILARLHIDARHGELRMTAWRMLAVAVVALAALSLAALGDAAAAPEGPGMDDALVRCEPAVALGPATATLAVDIYVEDVVDLYGADIRLLFDTTYAQVVDADPFAPGVQIQPLAGFLSPDFVIRREADNSTGLIWYAVTQINPSPPASGSGALARVTFQPQSTAAFTMPVTNHQLAAPGGVPIPSTAQPCAVVFQPCYDVTFDGQVNVDDLLAEALRWTLTAANPDPDNDPSTPNYEPLYDLDQDGDVDVVDIMLASSHWLQRC